MPDKQEGLRVGFWIFVIFWSHFSLQTTKPIHQITSMNLYLFVSVTFFVKPKQLPCHFSKYSPSAYPFKTAEYLNIFYLLKGTHTLGGSGGITDFWCRLHEYTSETKYPFHYYIIRNHMQFWRVQLSKSPKFGKI